MYQIMQGTISGGSSSVRCERDCAVVSHKGGQARDALSEQPRRGRKASRDFDARWVVAKSK
jgi:hypothetical protein